MPNDDLLDDILMEDNPDDGSPGFDPKELENLKAQLADLEKEKQGLLNGVKEERRKRQELKGRLDQVTTTVNGILTSRQEMAERSLQKQTGTVNGIPIEFTEDGDAFLPMEKIQVITTPYEKKIAELEYKLESLGASQDQASRAQRTINSILGENDAYRDSFNKYQRARRWVEDKVIDFQRSNNVQGALTSGQALDHVFDDNLKQEFDAEFEGIDLVDIVTAEDSTKQFRRMLSNLANASQNTLTDNRPDSRFQKVLSKPSGLGKSQNAKAGEIPLSERAGNMSATDILSLSDDQIAALEKALLREEQSDGITR